MVQYFFKKKKIGGLFLTGFARITARTRRIFWRPLLRRINFFVDFQLHPVHSLYRQ
jgi:hypothetical protein